MGRRIRRLLSLLILLGIVGWIVLSYLPASALSLPQYRWSTTGIVSAFPGILIAGLAIFVLVQVWLTWSTGASVRRLRDSAEEKQANGVAVSVRREVILTALPIAFTVIVAVGSYGWWQRLSALP